MGFKPSFTEAQVTMKISQGLLWTYWWSWAPHMVWIIRLQPKEFHFSLWISAPHTISFCKQFPMLEIKSHFTRLNLSSGWMGDSFQPTGRRECWRASPKQQQNDRNCHLLRTRCIRYYTMFSPIISHLIFTWTLRDLENWNKQNYRSGKRDRIQTHAVQA